MKKILFMLFFSFFFVEDSFATMLFESGQELRYRGKNAQPKYVSLITKEENHETETKPVAVKDSVDEEEVFSCLGDVWEKFKKQDFEGCYPSIFSLQVQKKPEALYLMGVIYEKGYYGFHKHLGQTVEWYTLAMAHSKKDSGLYQLALRALERRKTEALKNSKL